MKFPKLSKLDLQIMEALWSGGALSIREIQEAFPERGRPGLHDGTDDRISPRSEKGGASSQENRKRAYLRGGH